MSDSPRSPGKTVFFFFSVRVKGVGGGGGVTRWQIVEQVHAEQIFLAGELNAAETSVRTECRRHVLGTTGTHSRGCQPHCLMTHRCACYFQDVAYLGVPGWSSMNGLHQQQGSFSGGLAMDEKTF